MTTAEVTQLETKKPAPSNQRVLEEIVKALADLKFGSIEITVHESRVTQIERKEKVRLA